VTYRAYHHHGKDIIWRARQSRKGLLKRLHGMAVPPWQSPSYNALIGALFALGSVLFIAGSVLSLGVGSFSAFQVGLVFFTGSIPFTAAAFLQNLQAANAVDEFAQPPENPRFAIIGWQPHKLGWLSTITQFIGTIAFNFNTYDALSPSDAWYVQDLTIWLPGIIGSVLFLVSGYLAFVELSHGAWSWNPRDLDWQIGFINLAGCMLFMVSGIMAFVPSGPEAAWITSGAIWLTLGGALCFLLSALLLITESRKAA
jgi:hypothetical protein